MRLSEEQIATREVLEWQGLHLLHFAMSSCSQKVRILLREKALDWVSHPIDLVKGEQKSEWYLGINPNGVVPVLVHDGVVHIESNDILAYLDDTFPSAQGSYFPQDDGEREAAQQLLDLEDELHVDLRNVTFKFVAPGHLMKDAPVIPESEIDASVQRFAQAFVELNERLSQAHYLCGQRITLPDIAWFISTHRLAIGGYPLARHSHLEAWYAGLLKRPAMAAEIREGAPLPRAVGALYRQLNRLRGATIRQRLA